MLGDDFVVNTKSIYLSIEKHLISKTWIEIMTTNQKTIWGIECFLGIGGSIYEFAIDVRLSSSLEFIPI